MTKIDQFESVFKAATKTLYHYEKIEMKRILVISDLKDDYQITLFGDRVQTFLKALGTPDEIHWYDVKKDECKGIGDLLDIVDQKNPDLICTYRNLHTDGWKWSYSLGEYLDVLTQITDIPILVLPRPDDKVYEEGLENTDVVMAITDRLTGDDKLVNYAVAFTEKGGTLYLSHVEDEATFEKYMATMERIKEIDSEVARKTVAAQLLKEPRDYVESCRRVLAEHCPHLTIKENIVLGRRLANYKELIEQEKIDLLVLNTKDDEQLAMHGLAYPLAVELRHIPILMI